MGRDIQETEHFLWTKMCCHRQCIIDNRGIDNNQHHIHLKLAPLPQYRSTFPQGTVGWMEYFTILCCVERKKQLTIFGKLLHPTAKRKKKKKN